MELDSEPKSEALTVRPSLRLWSIYLTLFLLVLLVKFILFHDFAQFELLWRLGVAVGFVALAYRYAHIVTTTYSVNSIEIVGRRGVFSHLETRIPLNRITNFDKRASFLEILLGLRNVLVDTPGGTGFELVVGRLTAADAAKFTNQLKLLIGQQKVADAGGYEELRQQRLRAMEQEHVLQV